MKPLFLLVLLQEGIGLPGGLLAPYEEVRETERIVEALGGGLKLGTPIRVFDLDHPRSAHRLDSEPTSSAWLPVVVLADAAVSDQRGKILEDVRLHRSEVRRTPARTLLSWLNPFHGKLRGTPDSKPVEGKAPACPNRPGVKPPKGDIADDDDVPPGEQLVPRCSPRHPSGGA